MSTNEMMRRRNLRVTEQLLGELEAERFESALTRRILDTPSAFPRLLRACFYAQQGMYASARADVDEALEHVRQPNPVVELVAGIVRYTTRDYQRALAHFERAAAISPKAAHRARQQAVVAAAGLGWEHDLRRVLEAAIAAEPEDPSWRAQAVRLFVRGRHWHKALEHARAALEQAPEVASMWMEAAGLHARLDHREQALDALARALEHADPEHERSYRRAAVDVALDAGDFDLAIACIERALALDPEQPDLHVRRAELHSWIDEDEAAEAEAKAALALDPEFGPALRMLGALELRAGRLEAGLALLERAVERDPRDAQAHLWIAEASLRLGDYERAHAQLHPATMNAPGFLFPAWLLRFLIVAEEEDLRRDPAGTVTANRLEEIEAVLLELAPHEAATCLESRRVDDCVAAVEAALRALRGNRSVHGTHVVDGRLHRVHARSGCRHASRWALQLLRVASADECLERFGEIIARYPESSLPICHRGELQLWLGNYDAARADLEAAIERVPGTRWAYMGLSTLALLDGDWQACLDINARGVEVMEDTEGPAIHVYRGEAKRRLGRIDEAVEELQAALEWHPARASAAINLALAYHERGEDAGFDGLWQRLRDEQAPGLLADAARELDCVIWGDPGWDPPREQQLAVLERALTMMGGNRSSGLISYHTAEGRLRFVQRWPQDEGAGPHARDRPHLEQAKRLLLKALAAYTGPRGP